MTTKDKSFDVHSIDAIPNFGIKAAEPAPLRDQMTFDDAVFNVACLRIEARARMACADALAMSLDDRMARTHLAINELIHAIHDLVEALASLDGDDIPEGARDLASAMHTDAEVIRFQSFNFVDRFRALGLVLLEDMAREAASRSEETFQDFWKGRSRAERSALQTLSEELRGLMSEAKEAEL